MGGKAIDVISTNPYYKGKAGTIKLPILKCLRCRHEWIPITMYPKYCPICNSPYWNKPKLSYPGQRKKSIPKAELCDDDACDADGDGKR